MKRTLHVALILFFTLCLCPANAPAQQALAIGGGPAIYSQQWSISIMQILTQAYARVGRSVRFEALPLRRIILRTERGFNDGLLMRTVGLEKGYPNLVAVPYPIHEIRLRAYTLRGGPSISGWDDLRRVRVAAVDSIVLTLQATQRERVDVLWVRSLKQAFDVLRRGRVEALLCLEFVTAPHLDDDIVTHPVVLEHAAGYHYLHRRHAALAQPLADALAAMDREGLFSDLPGKGQ